MLGRHLGFVLPQLGDPSSGGADIDSISHRSVCVELPGKTGNIVMHNYVVNSKH